jgi:DNA-binding transcriptional regulator YiaG
MSDDFLTRRQKVQVEQEVLIPSKDGRSVAERIKVMVPALHDPVDGEIYLTEEALQILDDTKARYLGLLLPEQMKTLRQELRLTQAEISILLQLGEKTWTRWESGRERPSRSLNLLLQALWDRRIDAGYLRSIQHRAGSRPPMPPPAITGRRPTPATYAVPAESSTRTESNILPFAA